MKGTAVARANIAFIKYWGNLNDDLRLPMNGSMSMTLDRLRTVTTVEFSPARAEDEIEVDGEEPSPDAKARIVAHLDHLRTLAGKPLKARVASVNDFPTGAGLASSASGFAALTLATAAALEMGLEDRVFSTVARLGSGSATRSIWGGYVEWVAGAKHEDSFSSQLAPPEHWEICDCIALVSTEAKEVTSSQGHKLAKSSPLYSARLSQVKEDLERVRGAILTRDFESLGSVAEKEALSLHAIMMTSQPSLLYWTPATVRVMKEVRNWREEGHSVYFTIDAGPNVHLLTLPSCVEEIERALGKVEGVKQVIVCRPGQGARLSEEHLF
jgi:diphosphomevalonate decarboxylase